MYKILTDGEEDLFSVQDICLVVSEDALSLDKRDARLSVKEYINEKNLNFHSNKLLITHKIEQSNFLSLKKKW